MSEKKTTILVALFSSKLFLKKKAAAKALLSTKLQINNDLPVD